MAKTAKLSMKKNMIIFAIGVFFTKIVSFAVSPVYSRFMSTAEFGVVDILTTTSSLLIPILTLAIAEAIVKYGLDEEHDLKEVFTTGTIVTVIGLILIAAFSFIAGSFVYQENKLAAMAFFLTECFFLFLQAFSKAQKDTFAYSLSSIFYSIVSVGMIVLLVCVKSFGVNGFLIGSSVGYFAGILFLIIRCKVWKYFSFKSINKVTVKRMLIYSIPLIFTNISYWVISGSDKYITNALMGEEANGYLAVVHKIPTLCTLLYSIFHYAYTMSALKDHQLKENTLEEDTIFYTSLFKYVTVLLIFGSIGVSLLSQPIVLLYKDAYAFVWIFIPLYTFGVMLGSFRNFYISIYCTKEKTFKISLIVFTGALINAAMCFLLMKFTDLGLWATAISTICANGFIFIFYYFDSRKYLKINMGIKELISLLIALAIAVVPYFTTDPIIYYPIVGASLVVVLLLNYKTLINLVKDILPARLFRKKNNE